MCNIPRLQVASEAFSLLHVISVCIAGQNSFLFITILFSVMTFFFFVNFYINCIILLMYLHLGPIKYTNNVCVCCQMYCVIRSNSENFTAFLFEFCFLFFPSEIKQCHCLLFFLIIKKWNSPFSGISRALLYLSFLTETK